MARPTITHRQTAAGNNVVNVIETGNAATKHCVLQVRGSNGSATSGGAFTTPGGWYKQTSSFATGYEGAVCIWATREQDITNFGSFGNSTFLISHSHSLIGRTLTVYFTISDADVFPYPNSGTTTPSNTVTKTVSLTNDSEWCYLSAHFAGAFGTNYSNTTAWGSTPPAGFIIHQNLSSDYDSLIVTYDDGSPSTASSAVTMTSSRHQHACAIAFKYLAPGGPKVNGIDTYSKANGIATFSKFNGV